MNEGDRKPGFPNALAFCRRLIRHAGSLLIFAGLLFGVTSQAQADVCDALRSQLRTAGGANPAVAPLNRQLAAIRTLERQRKCTGKNTGGLFNACGDLSRRKGQVERAIQTASRAKAGGNASAIKARMASLGCTTQMVKARRPETRMARAISPADGWSVGNDSLFCVRLSDGYFFPAPNSGFVQAASYKLIKSQCQYICDDEGMSVYELTDVSLETEEMISVEERKSYKELPTAFAYRSSADFRTCDSQRYNRRVNEARARATTPASVDSKNLVLPLPVARPDIDPVEVDPLMAYTADEQAEKANPLTRKVRIVGAPYLPAEE